MYLSVFVGFVLYGTPLMLRLSCERISISVIVCGIHSLVSLQWNSVPDGLQES
jgi:hypothetical protein